jgi:hypothetical protein
MCSGECRTILVNCLYLYHCYHITHDCQCDFQYIYICLSEIFDSSSSCLSNNDKFSFKLKQPQCSRYSLTQTYVFYFCGLYAWMDTYFYCSIVSVEWWKVVNDISILSIFACNQLNYHCTGFILVQSWSYTISERENFESFPYKSKSK